MSGPAASPKSDALLADYFAALAPPSTAPSWQWCEANVTLDSTSAMPGRYSTHHTPMVRFFFDRCQNPYTRRVVVMVSAQSTKTQNAINLLLWSIVEDPGPTIWAMSTSDAVKEFAKKRLFPAIADCPPVAKLAPTDRTEWTASLIQFGSMNLILRGSNSRAGLQSDPIRRIICDERREWKPGAIHILRKRLRTFHNSLEVSMGTAGVEGDELHTDFNEGSQTFIHWHCPKCAHSQPFRFGRKPSVLYPKPRTLGGLVWDENDTTRSDGEEWNYDAVRKTVRYECEGCGAAFTNRDKGALLESLHEHHRNPDALPRSFSVHWNALYMPWQECDWSEIVVEFLKAMKALKAGDTGPMIAFVTETLGEPWEERGYFFDEAKTPNRDFMLGDPWPALAEQFLAVDVQKDHFWTAARGFSKTGESRLIFASRLTSWEQIRGEQLRLGIADDHVVVDYAYADNEVFEMCCIYGWRCLRGSDEKAFPWRLADGTRIMRPFSEPKRYEPTQGRSPTERDLRGFQMRRKFKFAIGAFWSNSYVKDLFYRLRLGMGIYYGIPIDAEQEYLDQSENERKTKQGEKWIWKKTGRGANHYADCECMLLVCAIMSKLLGGHAVKEATQEPAKS